jgi:hypothetical protein
VASYPGAACASPSWHLRFNFAACAPDRMGDALDRLARACAALE